MLLKSRPYWQNSFLTKPSLKCTRSQGVLICSGANQPQLRRRISNPYCSPATGCRSIYCGFHFRELSCRPSLFFMFSGDSGSHRTPPPPPHPTPAVQMVKGRKNVGNQTSQHSARTWQHWKSCSAESKRLLPRGERGGGGAQWSVLLANNTKQLRSSSCISYWQKRYGGGLAEKPSIPKRNHHFSIITPEESH